MLSHRFSVPDNSPVGAYVQDFPQDPKSHSRTTDMARFRAPSATPSAASGRSRTHRVRDACYSAKSCRMFTLSQRLAEATLRPQQAGTRAKGTVNGAADRGTGNVLPPNLRPRDWCHLYVGNVRPCGSLSAKFGC